MKNQNSNYALVTALYESKTKGLYSDIYFPIIKYAIVKQYAKCGGDSSHYAKASDLCEVIQELFHINIPAVVVAQTVRKIGVQRNPSIELEVMQNGNVFRILNAAYDNNDESYEEKEHEFERRRLEIEFEYQEFIRREGSCDGEVSFLEFISNNTENILGYFEDQREEQVDEKYSSMVFFLDYLNREKKDLYQVANQLFWSSVIVAFLQSDQPKVSDTMDNLQAEYYLDTSIVFGLLDLSSEENFTRATDVCSVIRSAGGILRVHPITLEEIKGILQSVERDGANPGTGISFACMRRNLSAPDLAKIRLKLQGELEKHQVSVFPNPKNDLRLQAMQDYKGKIHIKKLAEARKRLVIAEYDPDQDTYASDNFREVHDIFMDDYIRDLKRAKNGKQNIYFLTTNTDLIEFCREEYHQGEDNMISMSQVIMELWMHNAKPADVSSCALTDTMARCMDLHRAKVRSKLNKVAKCYNKTKEDFDPEVYKDFLKNLYRRAKNVIKVVEADPEENPRAFMEKLKAAIKEDNEYYKRTNSSLNTEKEQLATEVEEKQKKVDELANESEMKSQQIGGLSAEKSELAMNLKIAEKALGAAKESAAQEQKEKEEAQNLNQLYRRRDELNAVLVQKNATLAPLEEDRNKNFKYRFPLILMIAGLVLIVATGVLIALDKSEVFVLFSWSAYAILITLAGISISTSLGLNTEDRRKRLRDEANEEWDRKHPSYPQLKQQIAETEEELNFVNREIKNSNSQN